MSLALGMLPFQGLSGASGSPAGNLGAIGACHVTTTEGQGQTAGVTGLRDQAKDLDTNLGQLQRHPCHVAGGTLSHVAVP